MRDVAVPWTIFALVCMTVAVIVQRRATQHRQRETLFLIGAWTALAWSALTLLTWLLAQRLHADLRFLFEPARATTWPAAMAVQRAGAGFLGATVIAIIWSVLLWSPLLFVRRERLPLVLVVCIQAALIVGAAGAFYGMGWK